MESDGGGIAITHHSTLRESFLASDVADSFNPNPNNNGLVNNRTSFSGNQRPISSLTLGAVLNSDKKSPPSSNIVVRTLLEIIRNDETLIGGSPKSPYAGKKSWKSFKERLKLKRASLSHCHNPNPDSDSRHWASSTPVPQSDVLPSSSSTVVIMTSRESLRSSLRNNSITRVDTVPADDVLLREVDSGGSPRSGGSFRLSAALAAEREETLRRLSREMVEGDEDDDEEEVVVVSSMDNVNGSEEEEVEEGPNLGPPENQPVRMSLMDLLEETDRQAGISGPIYRLDDEEEDEEEDLVGEEENDGGDGCAKEEYGCCVCMVRHKGAAFIPCGHTFCRLCSRELWVQRGNCPICNNFILEILDIF